MSRAARPQIPVTTHRTASGALILAGLTILTLAVPGPAVSAQEPPDHERLVTAEPSAPQRVETTWLSSGVVPAADDVTARAADPATRRDDPGHADSRVAAGDTTVAASPTLDVLAATATPAGGPLPIPFDDLVSNYGCMMIESEPGEHLGVNCIDEGWLNTDGTVYVHTTVPAAQQVRLSSSPPSGTDSGMPSFTSFDLDSAPDYSSYEFLSKPFDIVPAETYYILAIVWDSVGNMAWRYGTATVPATAHVVIDKITVLNDGDEGSLNKGEIKFRLGVADEVWSFPEEKFDDGDSFDPGAEHTVSLTPRADADDLGQRGRSMIQASASSNRTGASGTTTRMVAVATMQWRPRSSTSRPASRSSTSTSPAPTSTCASASRARSPSAFPDAERPDHPPARCSSNHVSVRDHASSATSGTWRSGRASFRKAWPRSRRREPRY